ncbi:MAG TPA: hypothetical protein VGH99_05860 [Pseudonocardia sp.]
MFLRAGLALSNLGDDEAWVQYLAMGGELGRHELRAALRGCRDLPVGEYNRFAAALNDDFVDQEKGHLVPYLGS